MEQVNGLKDTRRQPRSFWLLKNAAVAACPNGWRTLQRVASRFLSTCLALILIASMQAAVQQEPLEYQVKAAFLLNFTRFVEWPASAFPDSEAPIAICIVGEDPFGGAIDQIVAGEVVGSRKVEVRRIKTPPAPKSCQVIYVGKQDPGAPPVLSALGPGVLVVGEGDSLLREGGMIAFILDNRRVRFNINQSAAEKAGLKLSARLLTVARSVVR